MDWLKHQAERTYIQRAQNLLINVPPGSGKSRIVSVCAPAWMWARCPSWRAIFFSANPRVALRDSLLCKDLIQSEWYQSLFQPQWELRSDQNAKSNYWNTAGGMRLAFGFDSRITGDRADAIFVDDPHDASEVESESLRSHVTERWDAAIFNRVNDLKSSVRLGIMQRLHSEDWAGHVLKNAKKRPWAHLCIPQEYEGDANISVYGWRDPRSTLGELMFPARYPRGILDEELERLGSYGYAGQHQQRPVAREGGIIKAAWLRRYQAPPAHPEIVVQVWDTASKAAELNAPWVCGTWAIADGRYYLLDVFRKRMEFPEGKRMAGSLALQWNPAVIVIEDKSTGQSLIQELREGVEAEYGLRRYFSIQPFEPEGDKVTRMAVESPAIEAGRMFLPHQAPWLASYEAELTTFPSSQFKDQVDMTSMFLRWARSFGGSPSISGAGDRSVLNVIDRLG